MLGRTFIHLPGVGPTSESSLWAAGVRTWEDFLCCAKPPVSAAKAALLRPELELSAQALARGDADWFASRLRSGNAWRLLPHFLPEAGYLDIETDGDSYHPVVTAVALYHKGRLTSYVYGRNMEQLHQDLADVKLLVTFNGKCFDVPVLERALGVRAPKAHVDLRFVLKSIGVGGGLKACEKRYGLSRRELDGVDGWGAVVLWREWERHGDPRVMETLLAYNAADVLSLEVLLVHALNELLAATPFGAELTMPVPRMAGNPFKPDPGVVDLVRAACARHG